MKFNTFKQELKHTLKFQKIKYSTDIKLLLFTLIAGQTYPISKKLKLA